MNINANTWQMIAIYPRGALRDDSVVAITVKIPIVIFLIFRGVLDMFFIIFFTASFLMSI
jgi:hypothetical protein